MFAWPNYSCNQSNWNFAFDNHHNQAIEGLKQHPPSGRKLMHSATHSP